MATRKLSGACLFVIFLCHLEWSLEALERRCAAYSLTVKSPAARQGAELGGVGGGQPQSSTTILLLSQRPTYGSQHQNVQALTPSLSTHKRKPTKAGTLKPDFYPVFQLPLCLPSHKLHKGASLESSGTRALQSAQECGNRSGAGETRRRCSLEDLSASSCLQLCGEYPHCVVLHLKKAGCSGPSVLLFAYSFFSHLDLTGHGKPLQCE